MTYKRLDKAERRKIFGKYILNDVFDIMYDTLEWAQHQTDDLYPEEVWHEMLLFAPKVRAMVKPNRQLPMLVDELEYDTPNGALLVQLATLWALVPEAIDDLVLRENLSWLKAMVEDTDMYAEFVMRIGDYEDSLAADKRVKLLEYHLEDMDGFKVSEVSDGFIVSEESHVLLGDVVNEAIEMGRSVAERTLSAVSAVNVKYKHAFNAQEETLINGIKALKDGRQVVLFQYVKQDNQNSQVFSGTISNSQFGK